MLREVSDKRWVSRSLHLTPEWVNDRPLKLAMWKTECLGFLLNTLLTVLHISGNSVIIFLTAEAKKSPKSHSSFFSSPFIFFFVLFVLHIIFMGFSLLSGITRKSMFIPYSQENNSTFLFYNVVSMKKYLNANKYTSQYHLKNRSPYVRQTGYNDWHPFECNFKVCMKTLKISYS